MDKFKALHIRAKKTISKPFVIPKLSQKNKELLQKLDKEDKLESEEIQKIITDSFFNKDSQSKTIGYALTEIYLVHNSATEEIFREKRNSMRLESPTGVAERDLFFRVDSEEDMKQIAKEGFKCVETEEQEKNLLGTSEMGIHFSKNLDILIRNQYKNRKKSFYCVVTKALLNANGKLVVPDPKNRNRDPDLNHTYHVSMSLPDLQSDVHKQLCDSMIYVYEYDEEGNHLEKPRNLQPYAVLFYELEKPGQSLDKNILKKQPNTKSVLADRTNAIKPRQMTQAEKHQRRQQVMGDLLRQEHHMKVLKLLQQQKQHTQPQVSPFQPINQPHIQHFTRPNINNYQRDPRANQQRPVNRPKPSPPAPIQTPPITQAWTSCVTNDAPICRITSAESTTLTALPDIDLNESISSIILSDDEIIDINADASDVELVAEEPETRSAACTFNPDFRAPTPPPRTSLYSDDDESDEEMNMLDLFEEWYGDLYREGALNENTPRWRRYYDQTGRFDIVFRGATRLEAGMRDVREIYKFADEAKTVVNLADPTNKLLLLYQEKKAKSGYFEGEVCSGGGRSESVDVVEVSEATTSRGLSAMEVARNITDEEYEVIRKKNRKEAKAALKLAKQMRLAQAEEEARKSFVKLEKMDFD